MKPFSFIVRLAAAIFIVGFTVVRADQLRLSNGDVISGELLSHEDGVIRFNSPVLGTLELQETAASIVTELPEEVRASKSRGRSSEAGTAGDTEEQSAPGNQWRSKVDVGFNWQNGSKDKQDTSLRFESRRKLGRSDYRLQTRYLLSKTNGTTSADSLEAGLRWRRDFDDRWFSQTNTTYYDDGVREIDLNVDQNLGFGYRFLTGERAKANLGAGVTVQYRHAAGVDEGVAKFGELFQDLVWRFHDRFELSQEASALFSPDDRPLGLQGGEVEVASDVANYRLIFESVLRGQITETMTVNLRYEFKFDNAIANRDARSDQRITTGLGYSF